MFEAVQSFFFDKLAGKIVARLAVGAVSYLMSTKVQAAAASIGVNFSVDPDKLAAGSIMLGHVVYEFFKAKFAKPIQPA